MKNNKSISEDYSLLDELISPFVSELMTNKEKNQQKILEICHVGKFLLFFKKQIQIDSLSEKPDFILNFNDEKIGLEHQIVIDSKLKEKEGFYENIFQKVETEIKLDENLPNFLMNCFIKPNLEYKLNQKKEIELIIKKVILEYLINNTFIENPIISKLIKMQHSKKNINVNFGAWIQKTITKEVILNAISKKESKIENYIKNGLQKQWLLLVIGSNGKSSFEMNNNINIEIESKFERIYILEDFDNILHQIK
ncbi:hypothetical protein [Flavobacterium sp.]|jgi:hypothetical protein|uniref:hypothetical protein n=1 Tax=Flavobacterium sp. TaxID=239 RepID=UPI0038FC0AC2